MAKVFLSPGIRRLQEKLGVWTFRCNYNGTLPATKVPGMPNVKSSPAQQEHRQRFKQAVALAKEALADPVTRAAYEQAAAQKGKRPFNLAVSDFYHGHKKGMHEDRA
jgi:hypothetical protein